MKKIALTLVMLSALMVSCNKNDNHGNPEEMVKEALKTAKLITPEELQSLMDNYEPYTLIDVRQELEHYHGYIPGSVNIPRGSLEFSIADSTFWAQTGLYSPAKDDKIILYCLKGQRSALATATLQNLGYKNVLLLQGGYKKWELTYPDIFEKALDKLSGQSDKPAKSGSC